jgi:hypothetical protein
MLLNPNDEVAGDRLLETVRLAEAVTPELMSDIVSDAGARLPLLNKGGKAAARIAEQIQSSSWIDVALALIEIELPGWKLRRLAYDEGEWHCSLSKQPNLPVELDNAIDAHHEVLPLAILSAFLEARRDSAARKNQTVSQVRSEWAHAVCCDNFA